MNTQDAEWLEIVRAVQPLKDYETTFARLYELVSARGIDDETYTQALCDAVGELVNINDFFEVFLDKVMREVYEERLVQQDFDNVCQ